MGGPYCETCGYFYQGPMSGDGGECEDPAKIIYSKGGQSSEKPWVYKKCECCNWIDADDPVGILSAILTMSDQALGDREG